MNEKIREVPLEEIVEALGEDVLLGNGKLSVHNAPSKNDVKLALRDIQDWLSLRPDIQISFGQNKIANARECSIIDFWLVAPASDERLLISSSTHLGGGLVAVAERLAPRIKEPV